MDFSRHKSILRPVLLGLGLGFFQQASGSEAAVYYSPTIMSVAGINGKIPQAMVSGDPLDWLIR